MRRRRSRTYPSAWAPRRTWFTVAREAPASVSDLLLGQGDFRGRTRAPVLVFEVSQAPQHPLIRRHVQRVQQRGRECAGWRSPLFEQEAVRGRARAA